MKLIVKESIYYDLQEALRDELDPDMQDAIRRIHPEEAEMILNSDHIPATDKIPEVKKIVSMPDEVSNTQLSDFWENINLEKKDIYLAILYAVVRPDYKSQQRYAEMFDFFDNSHVVNEELNYFREIINVILGKMYSDLYEIEEYFLKFYKYIINGNIPILKFSFSIKNDALVVLKSEVDYYIKFNKIGNYLYRQTKNIMLGVKNALRGTEHEKETEQILSGYKYMYEHEIKSVPEIFSRILKNGIPPDVDTFKRYYILDNKVIGDISDVSNNAIQQVINRIYPDKKIENKGANYLLVITDNPKEKYKMGKSPFYDTCQSYFKSNNYNASLVLNLFDENSKIALLKNDTGDNVCRAVIRYVPSHRTENNNPILYIDKIYGVESFFGFFKEAIINVLENKDFEITDDKNKVKSYFFDLKKALDRIGLKSQGTLRAPYMDSLLRAPYMDSLNYNHNKKNK